MATVRSVNQKLASQGLPFRIAKGSGYFYYHYDDALSIEEVETKWHNMPEPPSIYSQSLAGLDDTTIVEEAREHVENYLRASQY